MSEEEVQRAQKAVERSTNHLMVAIGEAAEAKYNADLARSRHDANMFSFASAHRTAESRVTNLALEVVNLMCDAFGAAARDAAQSRERHPSSPKGDNDVTPG